MLLMMLQDRHARIVADIHPEHHAAVLMDQDVTMQHIEARKIDEAAAHLEVTRNDIVRVRGDRGRASGGNREYVPPDEVRAGRGQWARRRRILLRIVRVEHALAVAIDRIGRIAGQQIARNRHSLLRFRIEAPKQNTVCVGESSVARRASAIASANIPFSI